jgi:hypothetical protein
LRVSREVCCCCIGVEALLRDDGRTHIFDSDLVAEASGAHSKAVECLL